MVSLRQSSFAGGLLGPQLLGRSDLAKYQSGLRTLDNFLVTRSGTIENRAGTTFVADVKNDDQPVRLVEFDSSVGQGILLEFGDHYLRFFKNGSPILRANVPLAWNTTLIYGMSYLVDYLGLIYYSLINGNTGNVPSLTPTDWAPVAAWSMATSYIIGAVVNFAGERYQSLQAGNINHQPNTSPAFWLPRFDGEVLEIPTVIPQNALAQMQFVQINDLMYIVSQAFQPQILAHYADDDWSVTTFETSTGISPPTGLALAVGRPTSLLGQPLNVHAVGVVVPFSGFTYVVEAYKNTPAQVSQASDLAFMGAPSDFHFDTTPGTPTVISWSPVTGANGYAVFRGFSNDAIPLFGLIAVTDSTSYTDSLRTNDQHGATAIRGADPSNGGTLQFQYQVTSIDAVTGIESVASSTVTGNGDPPTSTDPNIISWSPVAGASGYNVYKAVSGVFGFIGTATAPAVNFRDPNITPSTAQQPPINIGLFSTPNDYPAVVGSYQQRLLFANTINQPQTVWASAVGVYTAFTVTIPILDSGSVQFTIAGRSRQYVQALVDIGKLVIMTSNGEYVANGNQFGSLTPTAINLVQNGYAGAVLMIPVSIGSTALFVQARGNILRDLQYSIYSTTYAGKDTTLYAPQLFENNTITCLAWQQIYNSIIWAVQDNGALLGLTYIKDQEMWAWHQHYSTNGVVEQVCTVPEETHDILYLVIRRVIDGSTVRYVERMEPREFVDTQYLSDAIFTDSSLIYDGRNQTTTTITATTAGGWTPQDSIALTASAAAFTLSDVGNNIVFQQLADGSQVNPDTGLPYVTGYVIDQVVFAIIGYTSLTVVTVLPQSNVPAWAQATPFLNWGMAADEFSGLDHLEGQAISAQGDGSVVFNAETDKVPTVVTAGGFVTDKPYLVLTAGLPLISRFQTLPWEGGGKFETQGNKQQILIETTLTFYNSRGGFLGQDFDHLFQWKQRGIQSENMGQNPLLFTGPVIVPAQGAWQTTGQMCFEQTDPLPSAISSVICTGASGS